MVFTMKDISGLNSLVLEVFAPVATGAGEERRQRHNHGVAIGAKNVRYFKFTRYCANPRFQQAIRKEDYTYRPLSPRTHFAYICRSESDPI